jgi:hypothetical protein
MTAKVKHRLIGLLTTVALLAQPAAEGFAGTTADPSTGADPACGDARDQP